LHCYKRWARLLNLNRVGDVDRGTGAQALDRLLSCTARAAVELMHLTGYKVYAGICSFKRVSVFDMTAYRDDHVEIWIDEIHPCISPLRGRLSVQIRSRRICHKGFYNYVL